MAAIHRKNKPQQILHEDRGFWSKTKTRYLNKNGTSWGSVPVNDVYFILFFFFVYRRVIGRYEVLEEDPQF